MTRPALAFLKPALETLRSAGLLREPTDGHGLSFCSNDYLGLATLPPPAEVPAGAGASRLVAGDHPEIGALEREIARWLCVEGALCFSSGYAANVGVLSSLAQPGDLIISDKLNHASIVDGCRLSRARVAVIPHLDVNAARDLLQAGDYARAWVVTESYFSMDADTPNLAALRVICDEAGAGLIVDEAHAIGALGPAGRGLCAEAGIVPDVLVGTFGKALGASGAFVSGSHELRLWLWNKARSFVFSTGMSPAVAAAARRNLVLSQEDGRRERLAERATRLRATLAAAGLTAMGHGHVVPCLFEHEVDALRAATTLQADGVLVRAIRPPTVPPGTTRLRFAASAVHEDGDFTRLQRALARLRFT